MSGNERIPVAANVLGTIGTVFWCVQLVPQIWHNWRHKKTDGLPQSMMLLWAVSAIPFGVYMILQDVNIPLQIQPQLFGFFGFISWGQILYYNHNFSKFKASALVVILVLLCGGIEAMFILTLRIPYSKGITWPDLIFGIIASIMLALGFLPVYLEMWKRRGRVVGFNWVFLSIDTLGALFSLFALAAQGTFDILGGVLYVVVFLCEVAIYGSHITWRIRHRKLLQTAKTSGKTVDELLDEKKGGHVENVSSLPDLEKGVQNEKEEARPTGDVSTDMGQPRGSVNQDLPLPAQRSE
ncbi:uncharacterized protein TRUGW13939_10700 [Talaromyces rugulosus]|uniref:PQ loop repeat protein n=1 Tax=Talaromyces rugulosus TaxID=121627 RepID=A0A7H8RAP0_TALRU|nr:uncharacterized protein TRUGW13939_10700 [Talaromyces rugulosus]QKX63529.1 hypothetical protein TRUGW13939_10700 [Talaromyces rugulosus]